MVAGLLEQQARYPSPPDRGSAGGDAAGDQRAEVTQQSPERWPRAFACSAVVPSQGGRAQLCGRLIVFRSESLWLWGGAAGAGTWGQVSIGTFRLVRGTSGGAVDGEVATRQEHQ